MKPLFKNITKYNTQNYQQFLEFHNQKFSFSYNFYTITMLLLLIFCVILNIIEKNIVYILFFIGLVLLFLLFRLYFPLKRHEKTQKQFNENKETICNYSFYKWYFILNEKTYYYFKLYKVFETQHYFYLYINDENAALVNKKGFEIGTMEEFRQFIKKRCLFKYRNQK